MCVLHLHDKRCSLGIHESLVLIATSFTLRSPCSWKLQCEMYVLQFCLNLFSVVLAQLYKVDVALPLHRRIYVYTPSPLHIYIFTRSHPQIYLSTSAHPHICTSISHLYIHYSSLSHLHIHTVTPSHPPSLSLFLYIFSTVLDNYMSRSRATRRLVVQLHVMDLIASLLYGSLRFLGLSSILQAFQV